MGLKLKVDKSYSDVMRYLTDLKDVARRKIDFDSYGKKGCEILRSGTPVDTGKTAASWDYYIESSVKEVKICFTNSNVTSEGTPVVLLIEYGHALQNGSYVQGINFLDPSVREIFEKFARDCASEVRRTHG